MMRKSFETEIWVEHGEALIELGKKVSSENTIHHKAMESIETNLRLLRKAVKSGNNAKENKIKDELNSFNSDTDKHVWKTWTTRIRARKNNENKKTVRLESSNLNYLKKYSEEQNLPLNLLLKKLNDEYFLVEKKQKKLLDSFEILSEEEKELVTEIIKEAESHCLEGRKFNLAEVVYSLRGGTVFSKGTYIFGTLEDREALSEIKYVKNLEKKECYGNNTVYLVKSLSRNILKHFVMLRSKYLV